MWGLEAAALGAKANSTGMGDGGAGAGASRLKAETDEPMVAARFHLVRQRKGKEPGREPMLVARIVKYSINGWMKACATGRKDRKLSVGAMRPTEAGAEARREGWLAVMKVGEEKLVSDSPSTGHWGKRKLSGACQKPSQQMTNCELDFCWSVLNIRSGVAHPTTKQWLNSPGPGRQLSRPTKP